VLGDTHLWVLPFNIFSDIVLFVLLFKVFILEVYMRRFHVNKARSARKFRHSTQRTKAANIAPSPQRGGWRL
jgi:hypothetical protein